MDFFRSVNFKRIVIILLVFLAAVSLSKCNAQNTKPTAKPDTCYGNSINVLKNDTDPNGDWLKATKFNGIPFVAKASIIKKDTGAFILDSSGMLYCSFESSFHGQARFTYYVNDGKGSTAVRQTGTILVIRNKDTTTLPLGPCPLEIRCVKAPDCVNDTNGMYCVQVRFACELFNGCLRVKWVNGYLQYYIAYTDGIKSGTIDITEQEALYITKNACRR